MSNNATSNAFDRLVFPSNPKQFGVWKDLIIGQLRQKSAAQRRDAVVKGLGELAFAYETLLRTQCIVPNLRDGSEEATIQAHKWQQVMLTDQDAYIRSMLSQTLPRSYLEALCVSFNDESLPAAWARLETTFGKSNAQGITTLTTEFDKALSMDFSSVGELIQRVKEARNRVNRQSRETLGNLTMIPNQLGAMKVLALFPTQYWGFCLDKVDALLRNVFMNKSSSEIQAMTSVSTVPVHHVKNRGSLGKRKIQKSNECFYCDGRYNRKDRPHRRVDCPAKQRDEARGCHRSNIFQKANEIGVAHVKSKRGASKKNVRVETAVDAAFVKSSSKPTPVAAARAEDPLWYMLTPEQAKADIDALMASPPPTPGSSVVSDTPMSDDNDVDDFEPKKIQKASTDIETVRALYPQLIERTVTDVSCCDWVLDSGCGYGLTADESLFVRKQHSQTCSFTFGEGSKLNNTHVGSVKLYFLGPDGIKPFQFDNMALVPKAKANILSYQIVESANGQYKFVLWKRKLAFVAIAVNGAYYVQGRTLRDRQIYCVAVKTRPV
ncbi:hypothetical protein P3T76_004154 [Phytophthora citrophthora]|uniref:Retrovirus-related Pol polyprotein from transposon TNT 1-94-like beta-barrel domain-containing protein n=1 Tax=Phytophthora citrophthora TaxID=4793 RepID=A0AAD9LR36_9STRA|nr:hypothetical protein P3T76_004154 [Phytophthora citrophthora]